MLQANAFEVVGIEVHVMTLRELALLGADALRPRSLG